MNPIKLSILSDKRLLSILVKSIIFIVLSVMLVCTGIWVYHYYFVDRVHNDFSAKIENIKTMARHNALQIVDETIYTDTIDGICEIYSVKARIEIQYDLENLRYKFSGDTLLVELPHESIQAHELSRRLLDEYYADGKFHIGRPTISGKQSNEIEYRLKHFVETKMVNQEHIKRARMSELANMVRLFSAIHGNVKVVININEPSQVITPETIPIPKDL